MTPEDDELIASLGDVLDIIVAAEAHFALTDAHHAYYGKRYEAVAEAIATLTAMREEIERKDEALQRIAAVGPNQTFPSDRMAVLTCERIARAALTTDHKGVAS